MSEPIQFTVNDRPVSARAPGMARLLDVLREELGLCGTKEGCGEGECGACAVLIDGVLCNSCLVPAAQVAGKHVRTVEGLAQDGAPSALQRAFIACGAAQCGICTPGMLMAASALLARNRRPSEAEVRAALAGNLCRCTGYGRIIEAVLRAAEDAP
jgi:carbon-monoxide dehydrogenase small subunit